MGLTARVVKLLNASLASGPSSLALASGPSFLALASGPCLSFLLNHLSSYQNHRKILRKISCQSLRKVSSFRLPRRLTRRRTLHLVGEAILADAAHVGGGEGH